MKRLAFLSIASVLATGSAAAECVRGAYTSGKGDFLAVSTPAEGTTGQARYLFVDGRRGAIGSADALVDCAGESVNVREADGRTASWKRLPLRETPTTFSSAATKLTGLLIEPAASNDARPPLVVMVHGSERRAAIGGVYSYVMAAQGIATFVYDKRGTGESDGEYTQNFELLADDAAAALVEGRRLAAGRFGRSGYFGGSQGGWVAPLAATRSPADFVTVGFGLVASPIDEDREQMLGEAAEAKLDEAAVASIKRLSKATARIVSSHFTGGFEELERLRRDVAGQPWVEKIQGEYSGDMLRMSDADLRRVGRARFDNLELIWDYDAVAVLKRLKSPLLWVLAEKDREAPIEETRAILRKQIAAGRPIDAYVFPDTDHGMMEFTTNADGSRTITRVTEGYLRLLADWIKRDLHPPYGRGHALN
ncbi:alpha/beta hydrolase [Dokdonella sp.]|uniref:alpha/beta hydrolase family protein n=1 Tax=Dokdonella sp. TaxID=2291710 RepID=UPI001B0724B2|nr:alpha/beta hydrolase [Dokdonella sp.]MBO9664560.1 alpha/beta hydrolase [Dokdonella sp.]